MNHWEVRGRCWCSRWWSRPLSWWRWCYNQIISAPSHLPRIMAHLLTRAVMGGHVGHHGELMGLCHNWLAPITTISSHQLSISSRAGVMLAICLVPRLGLVDSKIVMSGRSRLACTASVPHKLPRLFSLLDLGAGHYPCNTQTCHLTSNTTILSRLPPPATYNPGLAGKKLK